MTESFTIGFAIHTLTDSTLESRVFNSANLLIQCALRVKKASTSGAHGITAEHFDHLSDLLSECCGTFFNIKHLETYVQKWLDMPGLPEELSPPQMKLVPHMFLRAPTSDP